MLVLIIIVVVIAVFIFLPSSDKNAPTQSSNAAVPASISGIEEFLHAYSSLCKKHQITSTGVLLAHHKIDYGYEIRAYIQIYKIDGEDAADSADVLRRMITYAKDSVKANHQDMDYAELSRLQRKAADDTILSFFGTDHLQGNFWDIDDCEYVDGKYLEFDDTTTVVFDSHNQSLQKTLDKILSTVAEKYPDAKVTKKSSGMIVISME